ncbi:MAG: hypothetical protein ACXACI_02600 [Candidatus Hodarchaeales archaeon]
MSVENSNMLLISSELKNSNLMDYPTAPNELADNIAQINDIIADSESSLSAFTQEFARNTQALLNGDLTFTVSKGIEQASRYYQAAANGYQDLLNGVNEGRFEVSFPLGDPVQFELNWRIEYAKGRYAFATALMLFETNPTEGQNQFQASTDFFGKTVEMTGGTVNYSRLFLSLGCFFQAKGYLFLLQSRIASDPTTALNFCYSSLTHLKKARFVGQVDLDPKIIEIKEQIKGLMISRIEKTAEACWNAGMHQAEGKKYRESLQLLERGSAIYRGLQRLQDREDFVLQEKLLRVSALESHARLLMDEDKNKEAAERFRRASFALRDVAEYVRAMEKEQLAENFETQKQYFEAMSTFTGGIVAFDEDDANSAIDAFRAAENILKTTQELARNSGNTILMEQCLESLDQIASYLETATALQE